MDVAIVCPQCGFSKNIPEERLSPGVKWATCPRCSNRFELSARPGIAPAPPKQDEPPPRTAPPWERRPDLGFPSAFYTTFKSALFSPRALFSAMHFRAGVRDPLAFGLLCGVLGNMGGRFWDFLFFSGILQSYIHIGHIGMGAAFVIVLLLCIPWVLLLMAITSLILHGCLLLVRGGGNGFEATFRVIAYSQAAQILSFVPFLGGMATVVWILVTQMIGLKEIHGTSYGRIVLASLIPLFLLVCGLVFAVVLLSLSLWRA
jgi:hypothetical protein